MKKLIVFAGLMALLSGCSGTTSSYTEYPIGIGNGPNSLKRSPCACIVLPNLAQTQQG